MRGRLKFRRVTTPWHLIESKQVKATPTFNFPPEVPIWVDPERLSGAPCFKGTRVPVDSLFTNLESGLGLDECLECFPDVTREQAVAVLEYAHKTVLQAA